MVIENFDNLDSFESKFVQVGQPTYFLGVLISWSKYVLWGAVSVVKVTDNDVEYGM